MDVSCTKDEFGRLVCTLHDSSHSVVVTASDAADARARLGTALQDLHATGYGECLWSEAAGDYRWMFRRQGDRLVVVVLWSSGVLTGWQHVIHTDTDLDAFPTRLDTALTRAFQE